MIVKNEENQIVRCLESCKNIIDNWLIIDTGSTDKTIELIYQTLGHLPGEVLKRKWVNFGHNRSELLNEYEALFGIERQDYFVLLMDADQTVILNNFEFRNEIETFDQFLVKVLSHDNMEYRMPYLIRYNQHYYYSGATHEFLTSTKNSTRANFDGISIFHHGDGGSKSDKLIRDKNLLNLELENNPTNARTLFYLAQTSFELGELQNAIYYYQEAFIYSNWIEEKYLSKLRIGKIQMQLDKFAETLEAFLIAINTHPHRSEAYYYLGQFLNSKKMYKISELILSSGKSVLFTEDILFVEKWIEEYGLELEYGVSLWWNGKYDQAKRVFLSILAIPKLPNNIREIVIRNLQFS